MSEHFKNGSNKKARNLLQQEPGRLSGSANLTAAQSGASNKPLHSTYHVSPAVGEAFKVTVGGRERWALRQLSKAGTKGVASVESPALRLAAYICDLRKKGVPIETLTESHEGEFPGTHARYILRATVTKICDREQL